MESKSFAKNIREELAARHKNTDEVGSILTGAGFKQVKPGYKSRPDVQKTEMFHNVVEDEGPEIYRKSYGSKSNIGRPRWNDQETKEQWEARVDQFEAEQREIQRYRDHKKTEVDRLGVFQWGGVDPPVKNDFTKPSHAFGDRYKINKMGVHFITEKQDNFRNPVAVDGLSKVD